MGKKELAAKHPRLIKILCAVFNLIFQIKFGVGAELKSCFMVRCKANVKGKNNVLQVGNLSMLKNCRIHIYGNNNKIVIGEKCLLRGLEIWLEDDNNTVIIGNYTSCESNVHLACIESKQILIGDDCMLSANIVFRVGDSHSLLDENGKRINPSKSIKLGNHVWIGNDVKIQKGVQIVDCSVVGTGAVVTKSVTEIGSVVVGNPANAVKSGITWDRNRIPVE